MVRPKVGMWHAAYDYVRLTSKWRDDDDATPMVYRLSAGALLARNEREGVPLDTWCWQGYTGKSGPHVQYGSGYNGHIFQASGWAADAAREMVIPWDNAPRVDIAVTIWYETEPIGEIKRYAERSRAVSATKGATGWKVTYLDSGDDGETAYIGTRESDIFVRIYDKWREAGKDEAYKYAVRFEVEYKGKAGAEAWAAAHGSAPGREWLAGVVRSQLRTRGVWLPGLEGATLAPPVTSRTLATTRERRLNWLRNQVRPTVDKLLADGLSVREVRAILGLGGTKKDAQARSCGPSAKPEELE